MRPETSHHDRRTQARHLCDQQEKSGRAVTPPRNDQTAGAVPRGDLLTLLLPFGGIVSEQQDFWGEAVFPRLPQEAKPLIGPMRPCPLHPPSSFRGLTCPSLYDPILKGNLISLRISEKSHRLKQTDFPQAIHIFFSSQKIVNRLREICVPLESNFVLFRVSFTKQ